MTPICGTPRDAGVSHRCKNFSSKRLFLLIARSKTWEKTPSWLSMVRRERRSPLRRNVWPQFDWLRHCTANRIRCEPVDHRCFPQDPWRHLQLTHLRNAIRAWRPSWYHTRSTNHRKRVTDLVTGLATGSSWNRLCQHRTTPLSRQLRPR